MANFRIFLKQSAIYSIGTALANLSSLLLLPIYTRFLLPSDYGILDLLTTVVVFLQAFFTLGIDTAVQILYFSPSIKTEKQRNDLVMTSVVLVILTASFWTLIGFLMTPILVNSLLKDEKYIPVLRLLFIDRGIMSLMVLARAVLRVRQQPLLFNLTILSQLFLTGGINIVFLAVQNLGILGIAKGNLIADTIVSILAAILAFRHYLQLPTLSQTLPLLRLGWPLLPITAAYWFLNSSDRFFLVKLSTLDQVGLYGIANRLATGMLVITSAIQYGWRPFALSMQTSPKAPALYASMPIYYFTSVGSAGLLFITVAPFILQIFATQAYAQALIFLPPLIFAKLMFGAYYIFSTGIEIVQRTYYLPWAVALAAFVNAVFNILLIPEFGALGASIATAIGYFASAALAAVISYKMYPLPYELSRMCGLFTCLIIAYIKSTIIVTSLSNYSFLLNLVTDTLMFIIILNFIRPEVGALIKKFWPTLSNFLKKNT